MNAKTITIIIDVVAVLLVLSSALIGAKRGIKKSANRILLVIIAAVVALALTKMTTNGLMNLTLPFLKNGESASSINGYISTLLNEKALTSTVKIADFSLTIEVVLSLLKGLLNLIVFVVLFILLKFLTWIIYLIIMREPKTTKLEKEQLQLAGMLPKKHPWWGALVGAVQGMFLFLFFFIPVIGISGVAADINKTVKAETTATSSNLIADFVPSEFLGYVDVYENTLTNKLIGWTKIDDLFFNTLTSSSVDGVKISLRNEVVNANKLYVDFANNGLVDAYKNKTLTEKINSMTEKETSDLLTQTFSNTTNFSLLKFALVDASNIGAKELNVNQTLRAKDIDWKTESEKLSGALTDMAYSSKPVIADVVGGNIKSFDFKTFNFDNIEFARFGRGMDKMEDLALLKNLYQPMFTKILNSTGITNFGKDIGFDFTKINVATVVWENEFNTLGSSIKLAQSLSNNNNLGNLTGAEVKEILDGMADSSLGSEFDNLIAQTLEKEYQIEIPEDFSVTQDEELRNSAVDITTSLETTQNGEVLSTDKSTNLLEDLGAIPETESAQALADAFSASANVEKGNEPTVSEIKSGATLLNEFLTCDDAENDAKATALATELNTNSSLVKLLKFKSNTYGVSQAKYDAMVDATNGADALNDADDLEHAAEIMSLFTVVEA